MKVVILVVCLFVCVQDVFSCSCFPMSIGQKYCDADYMVKVRIRSKLRIPSFPGDPFPQSMDSFYKIRVLRQFKAPVGVNLLNHTRLYTGSNSALCGISGLRRWRRYLIAGNFYDDKMRMNSCSAIVKQYRLKNSPYRALVINPPSCPVTTQAPWWDMIAVPEREHEPVEK